jgi:hypothetical protein
MYQLVICVQGPKVQLSAEQAQFELRSCDTGINRAGLDGRFGMSIFGRGSGRPSLLKDLSKGKLNDPQAFQARCGTASSVSTGTDGPVLRYDDAGILVTLPAKGVPRFQMLRTLHDAAGIPMTIPIDVDEEFALKRMNCTL